MWHFSAAPTAVTLKVVTLIFVYSSKANLRFNMKSTGLKGKKSSFSSEDHRNHLTLNFGQEFSGE